MNAVSDKISMVGPKLPGGPIRLKHIAVVEALAFSEAPAVVVIK